MTRFYQELNSKRFLIAYLVIVSFLLILWLNKLPLLNNDTRDILDDLRPYISSPPRPLDNVKINYNGKWILTSEWHHDKWTLVYFTHANCFPNCTKSLHKLVEFQAAYANQDVQILIIDLDSEANVQGQLRQKLQAYGVEVLVAEGSVSTISALAKTFAVLYLKTDFTDGTYQIEQQNKLFLVDPKARVYASFDDDTTSPSIILSFNQLRAFYAQSE